MSISVPIIVFHIYRQGTAIAFVPLRHGWARAKLQATFITHLLLETLQLVAPHRDNSSPLVLFLDTAIKPSIPQKARAADM